MNAKVTKRSDTEVTFQVNVDETELKEVLAETYKRLRPRVKAAGFRPGKAPDHIVDREMGDGVIQNETLEHAVNHSYSDAVMGEKLAVIAPPKVQVKKFVPYSELEYEATVEIVPPVKLPNYKKIKKKAKPATVDNARVEAVLEDLRRRVAKRILVTRSAEMGDEAKIDFEGKKDGQPVAGAAGKNYTLKLGSDSFIPGFEEALVGMKPEEDKTFTVSFPQDYHEKSLAGQPVQFTVKLHEVIQLELPPIDNKFAGEVGPFKTIEELKKDIKDQLTTEAAQAAKQQYETELLDEIAKKSQCKIPESLVAQQLERLKADMEQRLRSSGLDMEKYLQSQNKTQAQLESELRPEAERRVKLAMILSEVARQEKLTVGADEIESEIAGLRQRYTDPAMLKELDGDRVREDVYNHLMASKTIARLIEYAAT